MFRIFKNKYNKDPRLKYKKVAIPFYISRYGKLSLYNKITIKNYNWDNDTIIPWKSKFFKESKDWLSINIYRDKLYIHPISLRVKNISVIFRKKWNKLPHYSLRNLYINSLENDYSKLKSIHSIISKKIVSFKNKNRNKNITLMNSANFLLNIILLEYKFIPKFNAIEKTAIRKIYNNYNLRYNGYSVLKLNEYFINWKLINIYHIYYGVFQYLKIHPEWKEYYLTRQMIISKKIRGDKYYNIPIYLENYLYSGKWNYLDKNFNYEIKEENKSSSIIFNYYKPIWCDNMPRINPHNKKSQIKFPESFYLTNSYYGTFKEMENIEKLIKYNPEYTKKLIKSIKNSNCLEYVKEDYYKRIMLKSKPMYYTLYKF